MMIRNPLPYFIFSFLISFPLHSSLNSSNPSNDLGVNKQAVEAFKAVRNSDISWLKKLINEEFDINTQYVEKHCPYPKTALEVAIEDYQEGIALYIILHKNTDITCNPTTNEYYLYNRLRPYEAKYYLHMICGRGAGRKSKKESDIKEKNEQLVTALLNKGININSKDGRGNTPLHYACRYGKLGIVQLLLSKKEIKVNELDQYCVETPLHVACTSANVDLVKILLAHSDIQAFLENRFGESPLRSTLSRYHEECKKLANQSTNTDTLRRAQLLDIIDRYETIIELFLEQAKTYKSALGPCLLEAFWRREYANTNYFNKLLAIDPTIINDSVWTSPPHPNLLQKLCLHGDDKIDAIKEVLNLPKINPNKKDSLGDTALFYANRSASLRATQALLTHEATDRSLLLNSLDSNGNPAVLNAYLSLECWENNSSRTELKKIITYLLDQECINISLLYSVIRKKNIALASEDKFRKGIEKMIKEKIVTYKYSSLCSGYLRSLWKTPIRLNAILSILVPLVEKDTSLYFAEKPKEVNK